MPKAQKVQIGGDLIASLSYGLYGNPLDVYRELVQNAVDAYEEAGTPLPGRQVDIEINRAARRISVRDYATGLSRQAMLARLFTIGNSRKRGRQLRGFRGIGRLAALGYCRKLIFRSRTAASKNISEVALDSRALYHQLADAGDCDLETMLHRISEVGSQPADDNCPEKFFECVLEGVRPSRNDQLLNITSIGSYLSEVAPVPFQQDFALRKEIYRLLGPGLAFEVNISINGDKPLTRPHAANIFDLRKDKTISVVRGVRSIENIKQDASAYHAAIETDAAKGWILDHDYPGALPVSAGVRGLRIRMGNIQIGDERILEHLFREARFNVWCIGEIHICSPDIRPNTRRDNLEPSHYVDDLENSLRVLVDHISDICRERSSSRSKPKTRHLSKKLKPRAFADIAESLDIKKPYPEKLTLIKDHRE